MLVVLVTRDEHEPAFEHLAESLSRDWDVLREQLARLAGTSPGIAAKRLAADCG